MRCDIPYPVIDVEKTGSNIQRLREKRGLSVAEIQHFLGLSDPQAIYQWQRGITLPSVDHLCALSKLLRVTIDEILILKKSNGFDRTPPPQGANNTIAELLRLHVFPSPKRVTPQWIKT